MISEEELKETRDRLEEAVKANSDNADYIIIGSNLPKKHLNSSSDGSFRGSRYRGPSKNRKKWQVMKMVNKQTVRIGTVANEVEAARIYDFMALLTEGISAKTNFDYTAAQIKIIINEFFQNEGRYDKSITLTASLAENGNSGDSEQPEMKIGVKRDYGNSKWQAYNQHYMN